MGSSRNLLFFFDNLPRILWGAILLTLPVTSFRWFPGLGEGTLVRPLALYPLVLLLPILLIQTYRKKFNLHWAGALTVLIAFCLAVIFSAAFGSILDPIPLRGQSYFGRSIRALVTLGIGAAFFISAVWMNRNESDLRFTVKWIFAGLCLDLAWSGLQAVTFYTSLLEKEMVTHWQLAFSTRELVRTNRVSGLAYEPAWLAGQLVTIFFPFLFASLLTSYRLTRHKWLEPVLFALSTLTLLATYSRSGLLIAVTTIGLTFVFLGFDKIRFGWNWFFKGFRDNAVNMLIRLGIIAVVLGMIAGAFLFLNQKGYFRRLWNFDADNLNEYMINISAGARGAYSSGAYAAFEDHPLTGVGLGASGFYIYQNLPDWSLTTVPEIARQLNPESRLYPNPKNMYVRLLAETGLIGFVLFLAYQFHVLGDALSLLRDGTVWQRFAATAGVFAWLGITFYNFTQDSLATPNIWLIPGIMAGLAANIGQSDINQLIKDI